MPAKVYRWGLVGAGWMARAMAEDIALSKRVKLAGVVSRSAESTQSFAREYGAQPYASLEELLADPTIDVINITTPNQLHFEQAQLALRAGKHVLLEKPFCLNAGQTESLIQLAKDQERFLMEAMWVRFLPIQIALRELLSDPEIGELRLIQAGFHGYPTKDPGNRFFNPAMGGGSLLDLGIYPLSLVLNLFNEEPSRVTGFATIGDTGVDESMAAILEFPGGGRGLISSGFDGSHYQNIWLHTDRASIEIPRFSGWQQQELYVHKNRKLVRRIKKKLVGRGYYHEIQEVVDCLDQGRLQSQLLPLEFSLRVMRQMDALRAQWDLVFPGE